MKSEINISQYLDKYVFNAKEISNSLVGNGKLVEKFVGYAFSEAKDAWRASWVLAVYSKSNAKDLNKYSDEFVNGLTNIKTDGHLRETLKILLNLDLEEEQTSEMFDFCMDVLQDNRRQASVRSIAFQFLIKISRDYPELKNEILIIFENIKDYLTSGVRHSMMLRIKENTIN